MPKSYTFRNFNGIKMIVITCYLSLSHPVKSIRCDWPNRVVSIK